MRVSFPKIALIALVSLTAACETKDGEIGYTEEQCMAIYSRSESPLIGYVYGTDTGLFLNCDAVVTVTQGTMTVSGSWESYGVSCSASGLPINDYLEEGEYTLKIEVEGYQDFESTQSYAPRYSETCGYEIQTVDIGLNKAE